MGVMAKTFIGHMADVCFNELPFEERFGLIVDAEWAARKTNRLARLIRNAGYDFPSASVEDIEYHSDRKLDKALITRLSACNYIEERHNIIIMGATGNGKTYLSNAFGTAANRKFFTVKYVRLPELLGELAVARAEGQFAKAVKPYKKVQLLIIDEWLLFPVTDTDARDVLEIINARHKRGSIVFCSQFATEGWYDKVNDPVVAEAICDRIVHDSYKITIHGDGMRKRKGIKEN
jgi:DNA replication protein DnaC